MSSNRLHLEGVWAPSENWKYFQSDKIGQYSQFTVLLVDPGEGAYKSLQLPERFLLFAIGTLTVWYFSGGPDFIGVPPAYIPFT